MQFSLVPGDREMVRLIMLCQAVSAKVLQDVCVCVWVCGGCVGGLGGSLHTTWPLYKAPTSARGLCTECQLPPHPPPLSVHPSPHLLAFQLL